MKTLTILSPAATGPSNAFIVDPSENPISILLAVEFNGAVATTQVQYSADDPHASYPQSFGQNANWFTHPTLTGLTANAVDSIVTPIRAVRLNNTAWTSGHVTLQVNQSGN